jgi:hypothetical protein
MNSSVASDEDRRQVGERLREGEVAADGPGGAHADVRDLGFGFGDRRHVPADDRRDLEVAVRRQRANAQTAVLVVDATETVDFLDVDQVVHLHDALLHQEQQGRASGIETRLLGIFVQQLARLAHRRGFEVLEIG